MRDLLLTLVLVTPSLGLSLDISRSFSVAKVEVSPIQAITSNVVAVNLNQIRRCYEQLLQRSPNAKGEITVKFIVTKEGRVASASIKESSIKDSRMKSCITGKIRRWKFPKPIGNKPSIISYPFTFNPR
tara:strand:- start:81 stop:467 length:387 start_codon:yes stop_codon:yes gene_type:complete